MTSHAEEELSADGLTRLDLERIVLRGFVSERQRDDTAWRWKFVVEGPTRSGAWAATVVSLRHPDTLMFITVFRL